MASIKVSQRVDPPAWARLQRTLFDELDAAWRIFQARYTGDDGRLVFRHGPGLGLVPDDRDGVDDFYESFFNWPALYLLGGSPDLLEAAKRHWEGVTAQLTEMGMLVDEYERGYDWFHQGEGMLFFYLLCLADPGDERFRERAAGFADLYLGGPPGNYDPVANVMRAPHVGAGGPRPGLAGGEPYFPWAREAFAPYGLPLEDVPGIGDYEQLAADDELCRRMGRAMWEQMGRGDTAVNLAATGLAANAYFLTGDSRYKDWALRYAGGWIGRMRANRGMLPDNAGLSGTAGEYLGGRWYGGHYGWSWPHGLHSVGTAAVIAGTNAALLSNDDGYLELGRGPLDLVIANGRRLPPGQSRMSMGRRWEKHFAGREDRPSFLVPYRFSDSGWHDYQPMQTALPAALWLYSQSGPDLDRLQRLEEGSSYEWNVVHHFRDKEEAGHEEPWLTFLQGRNPDYPETALRTALAVVAERRALIESDQTDPRSGPPPSDIHHWQNVNPVVTEALTQLCCGGPQMLYNGGFLQGRVRYYDASARRPGLPEGVAALVESVDPRGTRLALVNLDPASSRRVVIQAGIFGEHNVEAISSCPLAARSASTRPVRDDAVGPYVEVNLGPGAGARIELKLALRGGTPSYRGPWDTPVSQLPAPTGGMEAE